MAITIGRVLRAQLATTGQLIRAVARGVVGRSPSAQMGRARATGGRSPTIGRNESFIGRTGKIRRRGKLKYHENVYVCYEIV